MLLLAGFDNSHDNSYARVLAVLSLSYLIRHADPLADTGKSMPLGAKPENRRSCRPRGGLAAVVACLRVRIRLACCGALLLACGCTKPLFPSLAVNAAATTSPAASPVNKPVTTGEPIAVEHNPTNSTQSSTTTSLYRPGIVVTVITFDVLRVRVPQGLLSESGKIWNHVDPGFLPAPTISVLHRNGLKVARGQADAWPPIKAILDTEPRVETAQSRLTVNNGLPLMLDLAPMPRDQLLFVYRRDGSLAGAPWRSSRNLLRLDYGISPTNSQALLLDVVPAIRPDSPAADAPRGAELWNPTATLADRTLAIRDLTFRVELAPNQFLAIGPSTATRELPYVMGSLLLCEENAGDKFESIYFITPTVTRSGSP